MDDLNRDFSWPHKTRELQNFLLDSTRWNQFQFRNDDIVIATWSKSGTTWVQQIISQLIFKGDDKIFGQTLSPWIEFQLLPQAVAIANAQQHRRFLKTHLPLDALVFSPQAKYIYVGRDARDVIFSYHHHLSSFTPFALQKFSDIVKQIGSSMPPPIPAEVADFYRQWLQSDIHSDNSFWQHVKGWWEVRHLPNVLFVHYANLKTDLVGEFRRIARFLEIPIDETRFSQMLNHCSLLHMKELAGEQEFLERMFQGGGRTFVNKGTNGRWRDVLSPAEIAQCDELAEKYLPEDCAHWLKSGEAKAIFA